MKFESFEPEPVERFWDKIEVLVQKVKKKEDCRPSEIRKGLPDGERPGLHGGTPDPGFMCGFKTYRKNVETDSSTTEYIHDNGFYISFTSEDPGAVLQTLKSALFVESCTELAEMPKLSGDGRGTGDGRSVCKEPETEAETPVQSGSDFINVRVEKLDELQNLTGELIISSVFLAGSLKGSVEDGRNHQVGLF